MKRIIGAIFGALTLALPAHAGEVTDFTLDNGMEVVVIEDHRAPVVVNMVWYRVGSADEPDGKSGIAHFLEHLMFKGTDDLADGELSQIVADNGGTDNAFTSYDYTAYFQRVAADRLELMIQMEADRMRDLRLTEEQVNPEREVILEERATRTDSDPGALLNEQMRAALYMNHHYGVPIIGWRHEMETLSLDDAMSFYNDHYAPNNAILIVAGDVDPEEVRSHAETYFGPLEPNPAIQPRVRTKEPIPLAERRLTLRDGRVAQPYVIRSYIAPERDAGAQEDAAALTILAEILGGSSQTSVLGRALQFDSDIAVYTGASYGATSLDLSSFNFVVVPSAEVSLKDAEAALDAELAKFVQTGIDPEQFERIKFQIRASEIYALDNVSAQANRYGRALTSGLTIADVQAWPDVLQAVTMEDVMKVAERVLIPSNAVTGWLMGDTPMEETTAPEAAE